MGKLSLVALDTDHIKRYVFATDRLREIRGASSLLDHLNRREMRKIAKSSKFNADPIYTNGGSGLFLIDTSVAYAFALSIQQKYRELTKGGASITFAMQELPPEIEDRETAREADLSKQLRLLRYRLAEKKLSWLAARSELCGDASVLELDDCIPLASHPFMRPCDGCGHYYAERRDPNPPEGEAVGDRLYCGVCLAKRKEDSEIKKHGLSDIIQRRETPSAPESGQRTPFAWEKVLSNLSPAQYTIPPGWTDRPEDFNELGAMSTGAKEYLAVIYADGNSMGQVFDNISRLKDIEQTAKNIDDAIYESIASAIAQHLPVRTDTLPARFPFDLLLVGGDDLMIVTPSDKALDIVLTIASTFRKNTRERDPKKKGYSLSVGVVLAPVKYPFGLLQRQVDEVLKHAKKMESERLRPSEFGATSINFMTVMGSSSQDFGEVYDTLHTTEAGEKFYGTLRPYTVEELELLLKKIREGKKMRLGRGKLYQMREAVLKMNLTTSVYEGLSLLRNWHWRERNFIYQEVYEFAARYQQKRYNAEQPGTLFPRVTFPWFRERPGTYTTPLLDFVELYDFVAGEVQDDGK